MANSQPKQIFQPGKWKAVGEIPDFPFKTFEELQQAIKSRSHSLGIDSLAAAQWGTQLNSGFKKALLIILSVGLYAVALGCVVAAILLRNYWLLAGIPIVVIMFLISETSSPLRRAVTAAGFLSVLASVDLLLRGFNTLSWLLAIGAVTFIAVRAANLINHSSFRDAVTSTETAFLYMYEKAGCTIRDNKTGRVFKNDDPDALMALLDCRQATNLKCVMRK